MLENLSEAWDENTYRWAKHIGQQRGRDASLMRTPASPLSGGFKSSSSAMPTYVWQILWSYRTPELHWFKKSGHQEAMMPPVFAARVILQVSSLDDSTEAAEEALSTPENMLALLRLAPESLRNLAHSHLPVSGEVFNFLHFEAQEGITSGEGYASRRGTELAWALDNNPHITDEERARIALLLITGPQNKKNIGAIRGPERKIECGKGNSGCGWHSSLIHDTSADIKKMGTTSEAFRDSLHCRNVNVPTWVPLRHLLEIEGMVADKTLNPSTGRAFRAVLPFLGGMFANIETEYGTDVPLAWVSEILTPSVEEARGAHKDFLDDLSKK